MKIVRKKIVREDCANSISGCGVRGFGNVTGTPKVGEEGEFNPHIERVVQGASEYNDAVKSLVQNNTQGIYTFDDDNWWEDAKGMKMRHKASIRSGIKQAKNLKEGMEKNHYDAIDDVHVNLDNRNHAIEDYGYGPMNPQLESEDFWKKKANLWKNTPEEAKKSRCGNCAAFNQSKEILKRIADNLGPAGEKITETADLGFCEMFHFKCAASRTCDAWIVNGPIKEDAPTVNVGGIAGSGDARLAPDQREPGINPKKTMYRRKNLKDTKDLADKVASIITEEDFGGKKVFTVPSHIYNNARVSKAKGKHWHKYLNDKQREHIEPIRQWANKNPKRPVILKDEKTGYMFYARH